MANDNKATMSSKDGDWDDNKSAVEFFSKLMEGKVIAHILHLQTVGEGSDARHRALETLYKTLPDLADDVIEQYQGCYGLVRFELPKFKEPKDALEYVDGLYEFIEDNRYKVCDETHVQNSIDDICSLLAKIKFRLRFLR